MNYVKCCINEVNKNVELIGRNKLKENDSTENCNHKIEDGKLIMELGKMPMSLGHLSL